VNYSFEPSALAELLAAVDWYLAEGGRPLAEDFEASVYRAARLLATMPSIGTPAYSTTRSWPLRRYPYTLIYSTEADGVCFIAVAHQSRAPRYWIKP